MKRKNSNAVKPESTILQDNQIFKIYNKLNLVLLRKNRVKSFVVAVSGGPDSMALAYLANLLAIKKKQKAFFVLVDHGIRKNSQKEALKVKKLLKQKGINLKILKNKTKILKNIQKNARDVRYEILTNFCNKNRIKFLLTAHHIDDQVETFLIRLSRGSGIEGLSSMSEITILNKKISYSARAKKGSKRNPYVKQGDLITVQNSLLGKSTGVIKEFTAPFVGIYSTKEIFESF